MPSVVSVQRGTMVLCTKEYANMVAKMAVPTMLSSVVHPISVPSFL